MLVNFLTAIPQIMKSVYQTGCSIIAQDIKKIESKILNISYSSAIT